MAKTHVAATIELTEAEHRRLTLGYPTAPLAM